ncbi:MAG: hypothetical protein JEY97_06195 [Bacteroidales bacterium]|nr:hypothetical protein [Bacteroidales bacterium]
MKLRETNLSNLISKEYGLSTIKKKFKVNELYKSQISELIKVYQSLGGILKVVPVRFGSWDIITESFIIELDEEQHFNRYRKITLGSSIYEDYKHFDVEKYKEYCEKKESVCLKKAGYGGYWKNNSTEKQFGLAAEKGDFSGNGSPRWKQRAFYDFCRDFYSIVCDIPVYRFSIYDEIVENGHAIEFGKALEQNRNDQIIKFINSKILKP